MVQIGRAGRIASQRTASRTRQKDQQKDRENSRILPGRPLRRHHHRLLLPVGDRLVVSDEIHQYRVPIGRSAAPKTIAG